MTSARGVKAREGVKMGTEEDAAREAERAEGKGKSSQGLNGLQKVGERNQRKGDDTKTHTHVRNERSFPLCRQPPPLAVEDSIAWQWGGPQTPWE